MFKSLQVFRICPEWDVSLEKANELLGAQRFTPCSASQEKAAGWIEPRGEEHGPLVESVNGQWIMKLMIETRSVPGSAVNKEAQAQADHIEQTTGRKPGKKEMKALKEDALMKLLPQAFSRQASVLVWIDRENRMLMLEASSQARVDEVITALIRCFDGLSILPLQTNITPSAAMTQWLLIEDQDDLPDGFGIGRQTELKSMDEEKSVVKFNRHHLLTEEVRKHIAEGKLPTRLAMDYEGRVGFVLTEGFALKNIAFLEGVYDTEKDMDVGFDADVAIGTGEISKLIPALIEALGGEMDALKKPAEQEEGEAIAA